MTLRFARLSLCLSTALSVFSFCIPVTAQIADTSTEVGVADVELPNAPQPQQTPSPDSAQQPASAQQPSPSTAQPQDAGKPQTDDEMKRRELAEEQIKEQQKQRVLGIVPNFNTSYVYGAASLTAGQKFRLAFRSQIDPVSFAVAGFVAGIGQAEGSHYGYGGGWGGYAKRYGQTYTDNFDGQMIGNAILPSLLHQDPRYFRLGRGPAKRRLLYALGTNVIARHDITGKWEPNYSNVLGNFASGGISNLYLPKNERGFGSTMTGGLTVLLEGGLGSLFQEFWPDISRRFLHKDPTNGQDAINAMKPDPAGGGNPFSNHRAQ